MTRFEVVGLASDRALVRALTRRLADVGPEAEALRAGMKQALGEKPSKGGILAALRRSPLVGANLDLSRPDEDRDPIAL